MDVKLRGFKALDFNEAQRIADMVNFDVLQYAKKLRACGPGCDYFSKDKNFFITMLLKHIGSLQQNTRSIQRLPAEVIEWYQRARKIECEQQEAEKHFMRIRLNK